MIAADARRLWAEALGCFFLFATVVGSGIMAERLSGGNDGLALLANALATGAILYVLITGLGPISGAQFNPAVSLIMRWRGDGRWGLLPLILAAQLVGGCLGVWAAHAMFEMPIWQVSTHIRTGPAQWLSEGIATFGLVMTILLTVRHKPDAVPACVALYIVAAYWFTASTSFANPAITVARSLTDSFSGIAPQDVPVFIVAQLAGAAAAHVLERRILPA